MSRFNGVQLMSFGRGGHEGRGKGRFTKKARYDGGEGSNGDSRDSEWGGHVEISFLDFCDVLIACILF